MEIQQVASIIHSIAEGIEDVCRQSLQDNSSEVIFAIHEQLYGGIDANGKYLSPTYDDDPFFLEKGQWQGRAEAYKKWKFAITPPTTGFRLQLPPRPPEVPNLFINGKFYSEINASPSIDGIELDPGMGNGVDIVDKYGEDILRLSDEGVKYYNENFLEPTLIDFFNQCGYTNNQ